MLHSWTFVLQLQTVCQPLQSRTGMWERWEGGCVCTWCFYLPSSIFPHFRISSHLSKLVLYAQISLHEKQVLGFRELLLLSCPGLFLLGSAASWTREKPLDQEDDWLSPYWAGFPWDSTPTPGGFSSLSCRWGKGKGGLFTHHQITCWVV